MSDIAIPVGIPIIRDRGCFNCVHWHGSGSEALKARIEEVFKAFYFQCRDMGMGEERSRRAVMNGLRALESKEAGVCKVPGDPVKTMILGLIKAGVEPPTFTAAGAICEQWTGREKVTAPLDKLPDELRDILGLPQPTAPAPVLIEAAPPEGEPVITLHDGHELKV